MRIVCMLLAPLYSERTSGMENVEADREMYWRMSRFSWVPEILLLQRLSKYYMLLANIWLNY